MRLAIICATLLALSSAARAAVPDRVTFTARLADADKPVEGAVSIKLDLYRASSGGTAVWTETQNTTATEGLVSIGMGEQTKLDAAVLDGTLFLEITVNSTVLSPRLAIGSVPYALSARTAEKLGDLRPEDVQKKITAACPAGSSIGAINADGTVTCETDDNTTNTFTGGLVESGGTVTTDPAVLQRRISGTCPAGSSVSAINADGTVACEVDDNTTYTPGTGIAISATNVISADFTAAQRRVGGFCAAGASIRAINSDGTVLCETDTDTNTTYSVTCPSNEFVRSMNSSGVAGCGTVTTVTLSATSTGGLSASSSTTSAKAFCGLTRVQGINVDDPRCTLSFNSLTDIWTITADSSNVTGSQMICEARCF